MKTFTKYLLLPLCCLFMAAGCGKDDLPTGGQPEGPGSETGILSFENWDLTVADDMEILPTDNAPGTSSTRSTVDAPDDYIVKIYNSKKEQVGSYTYAEIKTTGNIELPQDSYTVTAESPNYASIPDVAWETPVYYGEVSVNVIKKLTTTVNNLVCKLGNIKTTVGLSADLDNLFKPDDETDKLTVTLSIQDNSLVYGRAEATGETLKPGFFRAVDTDNTLKIVLSGQYNKAGEGEPASYVPVNWSQEIQNVKAGQWRKINIKILHASDGNVQFQVTVETWVYDEKIDVDVMSSFYSYGEEEIPDEEISDENSPAVTLENGDIAQPYPITTSMFDFDVQSCSPMITAVVTPYQGSTVASLEVVFDSDNAQFLEALATAGYSNNTVALWPGENPAGDYCVVKQSGSDLLVKVNYNGMKGLYDHTGTHTAKFIAIDSEGRRSYTTMTIKVTHDSGTAEGPNIFWSTNPEGTDIVDIEPQQTVLKEVVCPTTNIGVKVVFDQTILDKMDPGFKAYVSAIDTFSKTEAENGSVPTLKYTENATGYYLLPEDVHNLSWGFYSSSTELGSVSKTGVIPTPESGNLYTLTFKYSKTPNGYLGITVQVDEDGEIHEDPFIFSPQPTIKGDGFDINSVIGFNTDDISFAVSSVQALSGISIKANDETIQVLSDGALLPEAAAKGISYTKTDDNSGKLSLGGTFFSTFAGGIHEVEFTMTDVAQAEGTGKARIATPGLTDLAVYDLWLNTADFQAIVTDPALTNVKVRYRERERLAESPAFGEWKTVTAVAGADYTYTAQAIDFAADRDYEYQLLINDAETGEVHNFSAATGIQLPNAGFETWTNSKTWYPCSADEIGSNGMGTGYTGFWGTGNPGANAAGIVVTEPADDPRPGSTGSKSALLKTQSAFGVIAAGNLFIGAFGGVHNITKGDVYMGRPFTFNARPKAITFWYKGTVGSGDKARFFVCMGKWSSYHKIDTNDQSTFFDPSQESLPEGPIYGHGDWLNDTSQSDWKKIVIPIEYRSDEKPNYLMVTASASYCGDYMEGNKESRMYIDDIEFVY